MPAIPVHIGSTQSFQQPATASNPLPSLLHTPTGLAIIEIQGIIHADVPSVEASTEHGVIPAQTPVGELVFPHYDPSAPLDDTKWMKRVYMYIGKNQRMTGEVKKLPKPYGVLRRREDSMSDSEELEIVEIVKYKIAFSSRPEPVGEETLG